MNLYTKPKDDEIEVSIFGPGYGECVLIHYGSGNWIIVDSCINPLTKIPRALEYLNNIGINDYNDIKIIVASHWHDDHIKGLDTIFKSCKKSLFISSISHTEEEFLTLLEAYSKNSMMKSTGVEVFYNIIQELQLRDDVYRYAIANRHLWSDSLKINNNNNIDVNLYSLSPSDKSVQKSIVGFLHLTPQLASQKRRVMSIRPNHASVVLQLIIGEVSLLLGADLEEEGQPDTGWSAIISSTTKPEVKSQFIKIPHHGSVTGHHDGIYEHLLTDKPFATITPYNKGRKPLPSNSDIARIKANTYETYLTANPNKIATVKYDRTITKTIKEFTAFRRKTVSSFGQVRFRAKCNTDFSSPTIDLFDDASKV